MGFLKNNRMYAYPYFLKNILKKGDTCIDIGANLGYITVPISKLIGQNGKVYSVEPVKPILSILKSNTKRLNNVEIFPYALGKENKSIKLGNNTQHKKGFMASGSNFILDKTTSTDIEFDAQMRKGSELFADLDKLEFIKCDIEGYESIVIPEISPVILKFRPIILLETNGKNRKEMLDLFKSYNYHAFILNEKNNLQPATINESWDIFFIPDEKLNSLSNYIA